MKVRYIILLFISLILLTGCWSRKELNELSLITSWAIDKEDNEYSVTMMIVVLGEAVFNAAGKSSPAKIMTSKSFNVCEAFRKSTLNIARIPNLTHIQNIIISEEVARDGLISFLDSLMRDDQLRPNVNIFIAKDMKAKDVLNIYTSIENVASLQIMQLIKNAETNHSIIHGVSLLELINTIVSEEQEAYVPGITIKGDKEKANTQDNPQRVENYATIELTPYAVFKDDKMIGWLDEETSKGLNLIRNKVKSSMLSAEIGEDKYYAIEILGAKTKIKAKAKNNEPSLEISVNLEGVICQADCTKDFTDPKNIEKVEKIVAKAIDNHIKKTINTIQTQYQSDVFGFGAIIHRAKPKLWKKIKKDWPSKFSEIDYTVKVKLIIRQPGAIINPLDRET